MSKFTSYRIAKREVVREDEDKVVVRETYTPDPNGPILLYGNCAAFSAETWLDPRSHVARAMMGET